MCNMSNYALFLDDERDLSYVWPDYADRYQWRIARTYEQAIAIITEHGVPFLISFDHDLGESNQKTGFDFAKYLVEGDQDGKISIRDMDFFVHSANPVGAENIRSLLGSYMDFLENNV